MENELVTAGAQNLADWHDACLGSLGVQTRRTASLWLCEEPAPFIYLTAITLRDDSKEQRSELERVVREKGRSPVAVCDSWSRMDLGDLGFQKFETEAWYVRHPDGSPDAMPLGVEPVTEPGALSEFERASTDGFEEPELHELGPFGIYGTAVLRDPRLRVFVRRDGGKVVSGAIGCVSAGVVGVYAVATVPAFRRRGYGEEVTWAAVRSEPSLPAVLQPSVQGAALYQRMGFAPVGLYTKWLRLP
jgi:GNAT superfamily N-acetyltransferase